MIEYKWLMLFVVCIFVVILSLILVKFLMKYSDKLGLLDKPNERKVHTKLIPRVGGVGIFLSFIVGTVLLKVWEIDSRYDINLFWILIGLLILFIVGILDDKFELSAKIKLIFQLMSCIIVVVLGNVQLVMLNIPLLNITYYEIGYIGIFISVIWLLAIINAVNLIDGLDGLAGGLTIISLVTISFLSFMSGDSFLFSICLILISSILGFMKYNFNPAKVFMGDTGSMFLGMMLGMLTLLTFKNVMMFSMLIPLLILMIPILDTCSAILRRLLNHKPLGCPDRGHLHHKLLDKGYSQKKTVFLIYGISILCNICASILSTNILWISVLVIVLVSIFVELIFEYTNILEKNFKPLFNLYSYIKVSLSYKN